MLFSTDSQENVGSSIEAYWVRCISFNELLGLGPCTVEPRMHAMSHLGAWTESSPGTVGTGGLKCADAGYTSKEPRHRLDAGTPRKQTP